jgi:hypothetical protein
MQLVDLFLLITIITFFLRVAVLPEKMREYCEHQASQRIEHIETLGLPDAVESQMINEEMEKCE